MRRATSLKTRIGRLALAYALALQALLGAWASTAVAAGHRFNPAPSLCRTLAAGETPTGDAGGAERIHCVLMCLSGACGGVGPPAASGVAFVFAPLRSVDLLPAIVLDGRRLLAQGGWLTARGPPSIV